MRRLILAAAGAAVLLLALTIWPGCNAPVCTNWRRTHGDVSPGRGGRPFATAFADGEGDRGTANVPSRPASLLSRSGALDKATQPSWAREEPLVGPGPSRETDDRHRSRRRRLGGDSTLGMVQRMEAELNKTLVSDGPGEQHKPGPDGGTSARLPVIPQRKFQNHSALDLATFSTFRHSPVHFTVIGHVLKDSVDALRKRATGCTWVGRDEGGHPRVIEGSLHVAAPGERWGQPYFIVMLTCMLAQAAPVVAAPTSRHKCSAGSQGCAPGEGKTSAPLSDKLRGGGNPLGLVNLTFGGNSLLAAPESDSLLPDNSTGPFKDFLSFCGPPLFGELQPRAVHQWVVYHQLAVGFDRLHFYDSGAFSPEARSLLAREITSGFIVVTDFREEAQYPAWAHGQLLQMHDCLFRNREVAGWVAFMDFDEYLVVRVLPQPHTTLRGFLATLVGDHSDVSHGCFTYHLLCGPSAGGPQGGAPLLWTQSQLAVELMTWRDEKPYCTSTAENASMCGDWFGHRKYFANPRRLMGAKVHAHLPSEGLHLPQRLNTHFFAAEEVHHAHYHGLLRADAACAVYNQSRAAEGSANSFPAKLVQSMVIAQTAELARIARESLGL